MIRGSDWSVARTEAESTRSPSIVLNCGYRGDEGEALAAWRVGPNGMNMAGVFLRFH
jgi:hypothetical protein